MIVPRLLISAALVWALAPAAARSQTPLGDSSLARTVAPGVTLRRVVLPDGPVTMHVLEVDLRRPELVVRAVRACDRGTGRERPSAIAHRLRADGVDVIAAINAGFFDLEGGTGTSESNVVVDGEIAKGVEVTESPFDKFDNVHSQFGFTERRRPIIDRLRLSGTVRTSRGIWPLGAVNGGPVPNEVALYTRWSGRAPRYPAAIRSSSIPLMRIGSADSVGASTEKRAVRYRVIAPARPDTTADTTGTRALLVATGTAADAVARLRTGDLVTIDAHFAPDRGALRSVVGGWPRIVRDGADVSAAADTIEGTFPRFAASRHPRSVVGFSRDSSTLYLIAVDGRQSSSVGMSLGELARAVIALGVNDALNLDGGGSTALVVGDSVVNRPSDATGERPVGDALLITRDVPGARSPRRNVPAKAVAPSCVLGGNRDPDRVPTPAARPAPTSTQAPAQSTPVPTTPPQSAPTKP